VPTLGLQELSQYNHRRTLYNFLNPYFYIRVIIGVRIIPAKKSVKSIQLDKSNSVIRVESIHIKARVPGSKFQGFRGSEVPGSAFRV